MLPGVSGTIGGALTVGNATAAIPAHIINVNIARWLLRRPVLVAAWWMLFAVSIVLINYYPTYGSLLFVVLILAAARYWFQTWRLFWHGCLTPSVIVSEQPTMIAAFSDPGQRKRSYPAVKIQPANLSSATEPRIGQRVITVAGYSMAWFGDKWADFVPYPLEHATGNAALLATAQARIPDAQWRLLDESLKAVPSLRPGIPSQEPGNEGGRSRYRGYCSRYLLAARA